MPTLGIFTDSDTPGEHGSLINHQRTRSPVSGIASRPRSAMATGPRYHKEVATGRVISNLPEDATMKATGSAVWQGGLKDGKGTLSTKSGALKDQPYGFSSRFEGRPGTNPEELIAAAHAGCFSMALSMILGEAGLTADRLETSADVTLEKSGDGFAITKIDLTLNAKIPGATREQFEELAAKAKAGCPVSKLLKAEISLEATLVE